MCHNAGRNPAMETTQMNATTKNTIENGKPFGEDYWFVKFKYD